MVFQELNSIDTPDDVGDFANGVMIGLAIVALACGGC